MARSSHDKSTEGGRKRRLRAASPSPDEADGAPKRKKAKRAPKKVRQVVAEGESSGDDNVPLRKRPAKAIKKKKTRKKAKPVRPASSSSEASDTDEDEETYLHIQNGSGLSTAVKVPAKKQPRGDRHLRSRHLWPEDKLGAPWLPATAKPMSISEEIYLLASYIRLQPIEIEARRALSGKIKATIEKQMAPTSVTFDEFGSLAAACEPRATFRSDIDLSMERSTAKPAPTDDDPNDSTDNSSSYEDEKDPVYNSGMSFNFATSTTSETDSAPGISRAQQARFLARASIGLRQGGDYRVDVRGRAKVPIINLVHFVSRLEVDISMGVDKTSVSDQVIAWYAATYPVFNPVVVLLKEFLHQSGLSKPFEGGIGSYRLYVMVGHVINLVDEPSNAWRVLNLFFEHFSGPGRFQSSTVLHLQIPRTNVRCEAEFKSIFRIRECNTLFQLAAEALRTAIRAPKRGPSILAAIFCSADLREDREESVRRAEAVLFAPAPKPEPPKKEIKDVRFGKRHQVTSTKKLKKLQTKAKPFPRTPLRTATVVIDLTG
ncbi:hypothetical protein ACHHYP_00161 [Achlya hypogyna]|uniref:Poly(A) RNA polymerase mitochondrial-like central palm domain-containing protein n=1 Tax=Achlya hypogyna TaxID=1202772 RepID=A0A1V9ZB71_ACHHY|nr:hypothetical protein ACHHYP_00161 [Achlya hypogyna]